MKIERYLLIIIVLMFVTVSVGFADVDLQRSFRRLNIGGGTTHTAITGIVQDRTGFLWVSTRYGLYLYDGYDFKRISILDGQRTAGIIRQLEVAGDGLLWVRTESGEVIKFDPMTNESELTGLPLNSKVSEIVIDASGDAWFLMADSKLFRFDREKGQIAQRSFSFQDSEIKTIGIFTDENYYYFNTLNKPQMLRCRKGSSICEIAEFGGEVEIWMLKDSRDRYWGRGRGGGVVMMERGEVLVLSDRETLVEEIVEDEGGGIWIGTSSDGLHYYSEEPSKTMSLTHDASDPESIPSDTVEELWADNSGNIWIGTRNGIAILNTMPSLFKFIVVDSGLAEPRNITAVFVDHDLNQWVGINDSGLFRRDGSSWLRMGAGSVRGSVLAIEQLSDGYLLLATSTGLFRFDPATGTAELISEPVHITDVLVTRSGDIWITTLLQGYGKYNVETDQFEYFRPSDLAGRQATGITATTLTEDSTGNLWIGFDRHGLIRLSINSGKYIQFRKDGQNPDSLSNDSVNCTYVDSRNFIWAGTRNGLNRIDPNTSIVEEYFLADGLPDNFICSIVAVDEHDLWISTRAGLARFSEKSQQIVGFDSDAGLDNNIFVVQSAGVGAGGTLFFGGLGGITSVNTQQQLGTTGSPDIAITSISVFGNPVSQEQLRSGNEQIRISFDQNVFSIEFATMDFTRPSSNRFKYRLKGLEEEFSTVSTAHIARYSRVQPGDYTFQVLGSNSSGIWSESPASIRLVIVPPFWMTWQFRAVAALIVLSLVFGLYKWRTSGIKRQRNLLQQEVMEREIVQRRLLTNRERLRHMASELILAEDRERRRVALILHDQIAQSLIISKTRLDTATLKLPDSGETLEFNKISAILKDTIKDTRNLTAEISPPSLHRLGLEVAVKSLLDQYGAEYGLETAIIHDSKSELSKDLSVLLYRSVRELLINIIKYAQAKTVVVEIRQQNKRLRVMVQDDGCGFDSEAVLSDDSEPRGFGLFSIQERLESLGGKFEIESDAENGTLIVMEVPISGSAEKQ